MADLQLSFKGKLYTYHKILKLFLGIYDRERKAEGKATSYRRYRITTQEQLGKLIQEASNGKDKPSQAALSKALSYLKNKDICYRGNIYRLAKIDGMYKFVSPDDVADKAKIALYDMQPFLQNTVFFNSASKAFSSTILGFKVKAEKALEVANLLEEILGDSCFEISIEETLLLIYLDANSKRFKENSNWLMNYFKLQEARKRSQKKQKQSNQEEAANKTV